MDPGWKGASQDNVLRFSIFDRETKQQVLQGCFTGGGGEGGGGGNSPPISDSPKLENTQFVFFGGGGGEGMGGGGIPPPPLPPI